MGSGFSGFSLPMAALALSIAIAFVLLLDLTLRRGWPSTLPLAAATLLLAWSSTGLDRRLQGFHSLMHAAIAFRARVSDGVPTDPFFAGEPLFYPWFPHWVIGHAGAFVHVDPPTLFVTLNMAAFVIAVAYPVAIARELGASREASMFTGFSIAVGASVFSMGPVGDALAGFVPAWFEPRLLPMSKFGNVNANGFGLAALVVTIGLWARIDRRGPSAARLSALAVITLLHALTYPLTFALTAAAAGATCIWGGFRGGAAGFRQRAFPTCAMAAGAFLALPYLLSIQLGKSPLAGISIPGARAVVDELGIALSFLVPITVLVAGTRRQLPVAVTPGSSTGDLLAALAGLGVAAFLATGLALHSEYKFLTVAGIALAFWAGPGFARIWRRFSIGPLVLLVIWALPAASFIVAVPTLSFGRPGAVVPAGAWLDPSDPDEAGLVAWVRTSTAADSVFVDIEMSIPSYTGRALFVAPEPSDGMGYWIRPAAFVVEVFGQPIERFNERRLIATGLLRRGGPRVGAVADFAKVVGEAPAYVVVRGPGRPAFESHDRFVRVWSGQERAVFRLTEARGL